MGLIVYQRLGGHIGAHARRRDARTHHPGGLFARLGAPAEDAAWGGPARFLPLPDFHAQVGALFAFVKSTPLAEGAKEVPIERRARGVPRADETWRQIRTCAGGVGVDA
jgi:hypothetical protein